jgi:hypothetical protein
LEGSTKNNLKMDSILELGSIHGKSREEEKELVYRDLKYIKKDLANI